jgi:HD-GYP domain-containing protein (c-di-GMP phosphodiesterase class II)
MMMGSKQGQGPGDNSHEYPLDTELVEPRFPKQDSSTESRPEQEAGSEVGPQTGAGAPAAELEEITLASNKASHRGISAQKIRTDPHYYDDPKDFRRELKRAQAICLDLCAATSDLIDKVRMGLPLELAVIAKLLGKMVKSVVRHPDAFVWVARLHSQDDYSFSHVVRCSIFAVVFGRRLGLKEPRLETLAMGALMCQIGKTKLPRKLLEKRGALSPDELGRIRSHVETGVALLRGQDDVNVEVIETVQNHCERFDGSGYPRGKKGDQIPLLARIVGLVDSYDAMTSIRPHTDEILSTSDDLEFLYEQRDVLFQAQLVEEFIQAFGIYPTGSLVELGNGQVAMVQSQNETNHLQPQILLVTDESKNPLDKIVEIDLREYNLTHSDQVISIKRTLAVGEFDLDSNQLMRRYIEQKRSWTSKLPFNR